MLNVSIAVKRIEEKFEGALFVNNRFQRATTGETVNAILSRLLMPYLSRPQWDNGDEVGIQMSIASAAEVEATATREVPGGSGKAQG
jgi:hypothetical protein